MRTIASRALPVICLAVMACVNAAAAHPVTMRYCAQRVSPGLYRYTFALTFDNHDGSWAPGYGLAWIIFADNASGPSVLNDFVGDSASLPVGPWTAYTTTNGGGDNGPTLGPVQDEQPPNAYRYWVPHALGETLTWSGTSSHLVHPDELFWSAFFATPVGQPVSFEPIYRDCVNVGPTGACCADGACSILSQGSCAAASGTWLGAGTACPQGDYVVSAADNPFIDISSTGTFEPTASRCFNCAAGVALPFAFPFYGNTYTSVNIGSNGNLQFGLSPDPSLRNDNPPTRAWPNNAIYACWDALFFVPGGIYYQTDGAPPTRTFTVAWINRQQYQASGPSLNFEAILHEGSGNIELRYGGMPADAGGEDGPCGGDYTIGVENAAGTAALTICGASIATGHTARLFTYVPPGPCGASCGSADFDHDGDVATDADIEAFFACIAGSCCPTCGSADFNADGSAGTDADIEAFFRVLAGGEC